MKTKHDGDCTIYASIKNNCPTDGICTCGYAHEQKILGNKDAIFSNERWANLIKYGYEIKRDSK